MEKKIIYLNAEATSNIDFINLGERDVIAKRHPEREIYSLEDFQNAFNSEEISDLGLIYIVDENKIPEINKY